MKKKILISTGGSGGHVIPATAFYDHFKDHFDVQIAIDQRGTKFINEKNYNYIIIQSPRLSVNLFKLPFVIINFIISIIKSFFLLKNNKIDILLGTGGYTSVPICFAAKMLNIRIYLFEPNMVIGRSNKLLLNFCNKLFCYSSEIKNFPNKYMHKIFVTKHILRKEIYSFNITSNEIIDDKIKLLIVGGSQGAKFFQQNILNSIINLSKEYRLKVFHQVNKYDFESLKKFYRENNIDNKLFSFEENIFKYINESNVAITRSGASTLSELAFLNVPFLAIPYKFATDNHQFENAVEYKQKGCCWILNEEEFEQDKLTTLLTNIIQNQKDYLAKKKSLEEFFYSNNWKNINKKLIDCLNEN